MAPPTPAAANEPTAAPNGRTVRHESLEPARKLLVLMNTLVARSQLWDPSNVV